MIIENGLEENPVSQFLNLQGQIEFFDCSFASVPMISFTIQESSEIYYVQLSGNYQLQFVSNSNECLDFDLFLTSSNTVLVFCALGTDAMYWELLPELTGPFSLNSTIDTAYMLPPQAFNSIQTQDSTDFIYIKQSGSIAVLNSVLLVPYGSTKVVSEILLNQFVQNTFSVLVLNTSLIILC
jgi:hypothetical protein